MGDMNSPQDNSQREWTFQKAVTIQTYRNYHPIPVPFNIVSILLMLFPCLRTKKVERSVDEKAAWVSCHCNEKNNKIIVPLGGCKPIKVRHKALNHILYSEHSKLTSSFFPAPSSTHHGQVPRYGLVAYKHRYSY